MKRLQQMLETECGEEATSNMENGVLAALRALCAALERKRPDAFRHVARQASRAPSTMLRSDTALAELALALARRITRENITWSKVQKIFCQKELMHSLQRVLVSRFRLSSFAFLYYFLDK